VDEPAKLKMLEKPFTARKQKNYVRRFADRILENEDMGVLLLDEAFRIVEISPMACDLLRGERERLLGGSAEECFRHIAGDSPLAGRDWRKGLPFRNRTLSWGEGGNRKVTMTDGDFLYERGQVVGAYILFRDITRVVQLEEQIRRSDRLKTIGQIAAGTAHEIRNPLTTIKGFMQLLHRVLEERGMHKERDYVSIVLSELDRVNDLVNEFLLLSKPKEIKPVPLRFGSILRDMVPMLRNEAMLHDIELRYEPGEAVPLVQADRELLKQVFLNLGKNAIEAMGRGGTLTIRERTYAYGGEAEAAVEFEDTGPGIPSDLLDRIFDPFFTTKTQGTGLGLSICQRIVHESGGRIEVSTGPSGTVFSVRLPAVYAASGES